MLDFRQSLINSSLRKVLKRLHYPLEVMLTCLRWYVAWFCCIKDWWSRRSSLALI